MKVQILNHEIVFKTHTEDSEHSKKWDIVPILEIQCINCDGEYQTVILKDIEDLKTPKQLQKAIKTIEYAMNKMHKDKIQKKKEMKKEFQQFRAMQKALSATKYDEESFNKAMKEYNDNLKK